MRPKVSVIIAVYGAERYIERCAVSLFEQSLEDIEYIFINDCTQDRSIEVLESVIERYSHRKDQIKVVNMPVNSGQAAVRRRGIELATGQFIIHCDSDDWVDSSMYSDMYNCAIENDADIVICDWSVASSTQQAYLTQQIPATRQARINGLLNGAVEGYLWNKLVKSSLYAAIEYYPTRNLTEDLVMCVQLFYNAHRVSHIERGYYYYFQNSESITQKRIDEHHTLKLGIDLYENFLLIERFLREKSDYTDYEHCLTMRKYRVKLGLRNICFSKGGTKRWRKILPELKPFGILRYNLPLRTKLGYIITHLGIYGSYKRVPNSNLLAESFASIK